jgi:general L-amino acid transport system substrate-binding protein
MASHSDLANLIWQIADLLRGPYRPPQYERVMLPLVVLRRFDCVLADTKTKVLAEYERRKTGKLADDALDRILNKASGHRFHNRSGLDFQRLKGDPDNIEFQSVTSAVRFTAMANGESDVLSRTTTWTLFRDTQLGLDFTTVNFYDGQGFMVANDLGVTSAMELAGATVCVLTGTTTELNLTDYSRTNNLNMEPVVFEDSNVRDSTFFSGGCDAVTNDKSGLASIRAKAPDQSIFTILPETISKEPLGPVVRQNDSQWNDIVMWSVFAMVNAEELGINSGNIDEMKANSTNPEVKRMLGVEGDLNKGLGLEPEWAYNIIKMVGNYGENYDEHMGVKTVMNIPRPGSVNDLWTRGGLMYSPPFR